MAVTPTKNAYQINGQWFAPTEDFGYGENPYDPNEQPQLYQQWAFEHQGDAQQIGQDYSPGRVGAIIGGTVAAGALADYLAAGAGVAGAAPSLATSGVPMATGLGPGGALAGGGVLPGAAAFGGSVAPAAAPALSGFGSEFAATGPAAASTTAAGNVGSPLLAAGTAGGTGSSFLSQLSRYIGPGVNLAQAYLGNKATNTARDQLVTANNKAKTDLTTLYGNTAKSLGGIVQQQQSNLSPYVSLGGAAGLLGQGLGINVPAPNTTPFVPSNPFGQGPNLVTGNGAPGSAFMPQGTSLAPSFQPGVSSPFTGGPGNGRAIPPGLTPGSGAMPRSAGATGGVRMQAPTGEIAVVDPSHVAEAQARGAKIVGGAA